MADAPPQRRPRPPPPRLGLHQPRPCPAGPDRPAAGPHAPSAPPPGRFHLGPRPVTGDDLRDTLLPDQTRIVALRDDLHGALSASGCGDARDSATTVRNVARCLQTYLAEIELASAWGYLGQTVDNPYGPDITAEQFQALLDAPAQDAPPPDDTPHTQPGTDGTRP